LPQQHLRLPEDAGVAAAGYGRDPTFEWTHKCEGHLGVDSPTFQCLFFLAEDYLERKVFLKEIWRQQLDKLDLLRLQSDSEETKHFIKFSPQLGRPYACNVVTLGKFLFVYLCSSLQHLITLIDRRWPFHLGRAESEQNIPGMPLPGGGPRL